MKCEILLAGRKNWAYLEILPLSFWRK